MQQTDDVQSIRTYVSTSDQHWLGTLRPAPMFLTRGRPVPVSYRGLHTDCRARFPSICPAPVIRPLALAALFLIIHHQPIIRCHVVRFTASVFKKATHTLLKQDHSATLRHVTRICAATFILLTTKELISIGRFESTFHTPDQDMLATGMQFGSYLLRLYIILFTQFLCKYLFPYRKRQHKKAENLKGHLNKLLHVCQHHPPHH